jgi:RHS repeat-associated protein
VYDGLNRLVQMNDAVGTTAFAWTAGDQLQSEDGPWDSDTVTRTYDSRMLTNLDLQQPGSSDWVQGFSYDTLNRLQSTTSPAGTFNYNYDTTGGGDGAFGSLRVFRIDIPGGYVFKGFDNLGRITSTSYGNWFEGLDEHTYVYDPGSQRTQQVFQAGNYINYGYDNIGQLVKANGYEAGGTPRLNEQFGYGYDAAWNLNRKTNNALIETFNVNNRNELTTVSRSGTLTVAGSVSGSPTSFSVSGYSGAAIYGDGSWVQPGVTILSGANTFTATASDASGHTSIDTVTTYLPATNIFTYDGNGDLTSDGHRIFEYDDENQLISVTVSNSYHSEFVYDGLRRRRIERDFGWQSAIGIWQLTNETHYVYDVDLAVQERTSANTPVVTYTRGNDFSSTGEGSGGAGGMLARNDNRLIESDLAADSAFYVNDGSGNITALIYSDGTVAAQYSYDPFGNIISQAGPLASLNLHRFSSKRFHNASRMVYYGRRYLDAVTSRWITRDPLGEAQFLNLYGFAGNSPLMFIDPFGLDIQITIGIGGTLSAQGVTGWPAIGGGVSVGFTTGGQLIAQGTGVKMPQGSGVFAGGGLSINITTSSSCLPAGISHSEADHAEVNAGLDLEGGASADFDSDSASGSLPLPNRFNLGVGLGLMAGTGTSTTTTAATPPLFAPLPGSIYTPITQVNSPPTTCTSP